MPPQATPQPNYDFFLNPPPAPKHNLLSNSNSMKKRVVIVLGSGLILIIIIVAVSSLFGTTSTTGLLSLVQQQNELIRVATEAATQTTQQTTTNLAIDIQLSLTTDQQQLLAYLKSHNQTVSTQQLALTQSSVTDKQLTSAKSASNYDSVYVQITQNEIIQYMQSLKQVFTATSSTTQRSLLNTDYKAAALLLTQTKSAAAAV